MGRWRWAAGAAVTGLLLTGCGSSGGGDDGPGESPVTGSAASATPAEPEDEAEPGSLAAEWVPQFEALLYADGAEGVCEDAGTLECAEHLVAVMTVVAELQDAVQAADADLYPDTTDEIDDLTGALVAYEEGDCLGRHLPVGDPSACRADAATIVAGPAMLAVLLELDEL